VVFALRARARRTSDASVEVGGALQLARASERARSTARGGYDGDRLAPPLRAARTTRLTAASPGQPKKQQRRAGHDPGWAPGRAYGAAAAVVAARLLQTGVGCAAVTRTGIGDRFGTWS